MDRRINESQKTGAVFTGNTAGPEITLAENSGFCYGVRRAVEKTQNLIEENRGSGKLIFTYGPLIHNEIVVKALEDDGVFSCEDMDKIPAGSILVIRSHGVPRKTIEEAEARGIAVEDVTCPFVERIHKIVSDDSESGKQIVVAGDENHPEVIGILGWCSGISICARTEEELNTEPLDINRPVALVAQTTIKSRDFDDIHSRLINEGFDVKPYNTICSATRERQLGCEKTAAESDIMLVIGSRNSSNTMKLFDIAKNNCNNTYLIEILEDLPLKEIKKCSKIGIAAGASAPECIIKEVISTMSEFINENGQETMGMADYMDAIEKSLRLPGRGEIVTGTVFSVNDRQIVVDLGHKKDGIIPKDEVSLEAGQTLKDAFNVGDEIEAKVLKTKDDDGNILLSLKKLEVNAQWKEVNDALEDKTLVTVKVTNKVKGGVIAAYKEVSGFIPLSQLSDKFTEDVDAFIGQEILVKVIQTNPKRNRAVFSHRAVLLEEKAKKTEAFWNSIEVGDVVDGVVKRFTDYGAFVDIGGVDGLLHISEISWGKIRKPQDVLELEQQIKVKILSMNREKGKISLGLKQTVPEPWANIDNKYQVGDIIVGKVVQLKEYGAFIEIEPGLDGLVHISEIAYKRVASPANELEVGQSVNAKILDIDAEKKRISLSIKETLDKPEAEEAEEATEE